jgi:hypothetical protein
MQFKSRKTKKIIPMDKAIVLQFVAELEAKIAQIKEELAKE